MEKKCINDRKGEAIEYNHTLISDKHYFSGFLNLADDNINKVFKLFYDRFTPTKTYKVSISAILSEEFKDTTAPSEYIMKVEFLKQYFPVVEYLYLEITDDRFKNTKSEEKENERRKYFIKNLKSLTSTITHLRHFYTHHYHKPTNINEEVYLFLDDTLLKVIETVKKKRMKRDQTRMLLKDTLSKSKEMDVLKHERKEYLIEKEKRGDRVGLNEDDIENGVLNNAFDHLLYKEKINNRYKSKYDTNNEAYVEPENGITITESGLIFLLSMFLPKRENEELKSRIRGYKAKVISNPEKPISRQNNSIKYMATHWVFNYLSMKPIRHRLNTTFQKETLLMQMVDELSKVPDEIYQTLSEKDKNSFIEDINSYYKDLEEIKNNKDNDLEPLVEHPVIRKRYEDKFNYFVLRYLDEFAEFPTLRFQVHLGNYVHDRRQKTIDGTGYITERVIKQKINAFGKLSELTDLKTDFFEKNKDDNSEQWEQFPNPSYNFVGTNIPIHFTPNNEINGLDRLLGIISHHKKEALKDKEENQNKHKLRKNEIIKDISDTISFGDPVAFLSLNDLQALLYEHLVNKKSGKEIEEIIVAKLLEVLYDIKNYSKDTSESTRNITKNLKKSSDKETIKIDKLIRDIGIEIDITDQKLEMIKQNINEKRDGKRNYIFYNNELGKEATWLANDIKRLMPKTTKENWKGYQHSQLQQSIAFYDTRPKEAFKLLKSCWDFNSNHLFNHFIKGAFRETTFEAFYRKYLYERKEYFDNLKLHLENNKNNSSIRKKLINQQLVFNVFYKRNYLIMPTRDQINQLLSKPLVLERGIFDPKPTYIKGKDINLNPNSYADWYIYIQSDKHELQSFYDLNGDYTDLFEKLKETDLYKSNKYNLSVKEQKDVLIRKQSRKIKRVKGQDIFMNLMVNNMIKTFTEDPTFNIKLSDYYVSKDERMAQNRMAHSQSKREVGDDSENIINEASIWSKTIPLQIANVREDEVKIKDIGKFILLARDEKAKLIFEYFPNRVWTKTELEGELKKYENIRREKFFKFIHELESYILKSYNKDSSKHPHDLTFKGNPSFKAYIINGLLKKYNIASEIDVNWINNNSKSYEDPKTISELKNISKEAQDAFLLIYLRNKVAHNELPVKDYYETIASKHNNHEESVVDIICNFAEKKSSYFKKMTSYFKEENKDVEF